MGHPNGASKTAVDIAAILDAAELPRTSVKICLKGTLVAEYEQIDAQLQNVKPAASLAGDASASRLAERLDELRAEMLGHEVAFTFQALPSRQFSDLRAKIPEKKDGQPIEQWQDLYHVWICQLVATCCLEPAMTSEQADQLSERLSDAQWSALCNAAWRVNANKQDVPFSNAAFALSLTSGAKSKRQEQQEPPAADSSADPSSNAPSTSATSLAG